MCERDNRADRDAAALEHDRKFYPEPTTNTKGQPHWPSSSAMAWHKKDTEKNKHNTMEKKDLCKSRKACYEKYDLRTFRQHMYQEMHSRKFEKYVRDKHTSKPNQVQRSS